MFLIVVEDFLKNFLTDPIKIIIGGKNNVINTVEQTLKYVGNEYGKLVEIKNMISKGEWNTPVLIFVQSKERALELYNELKEHRSIRYDFIHAVINHHISLPSIIFLFRIYLNNKEKILLPTFV